MNFLHKQSKSKKEIIWGVGAGGEVAGEGSVSEFF